MSNHEKLLEEFEASARSAVSVQSLMQQMSDRLHEEKARYNWVGFYLMDVQTRNALVVGPYAGSFPPTPRIPLDKGLCGAAATSGKSVVVNNVADDPRYLGSDLVKSNMVVPIFVHQKVAAELCIESYFSGTFDPAERRFVESCAALIGRFMERQAGGSKR